MIKWITVVALLASTERKRYSVSWCHNRSHVDCYVTTLLYDGLRRAPREHGRGWVPWRKIFHIRHEKKRYLQRSYVFIEHFMAFNINATRKLHKIAHHHNTWLNSPHQPSLEKKRTAILFTVARARFKCVFFIVNQTCHIARRRSESVMKTVNRIIAHVTNYVICAYPARKWLNFASIFTDHSSAREVILTLHCHQAATNLDTFCMCLHWYSDYPHGTECFL